jgi:hypothetical protein
VGGKLLAIRETPVLAEIDSNKPKASAEDG